jgi:hypothetical protein
LYSYKKAYTDEPLTATATTTTTTATVVNKERKIHFCTLALAKKKTPYLYGPTIGVQTRSWHKAQIGNFPFLPTAHIHSLCGRYKIIFTNDYLFVNLFNKIFKLLG